MCFDGSARAVTHEILLQVRLFWGVPGSLSVENSYARMMYFFWKIASGVQHNMMPCANVGPKALVPLWMNKRYHLPFR